MISPTKKDITLEFSHGEELQDMYHLLKGVGKVSKDVKFKKVSEINKDILYYFIQQALVLDAD